MDKKITTTSPERLSMTTNQHILHFHESIITNLHLIIQTITKIIITRQNNVFNLTIISIIHINHHSIKILIKHVINTISPQTLSLMTASLILTHSLIINNHIILQQMLISTLLQVLIIRMATMRRKIK